MRSVAHLAARVETVDLAVREATEASVAMEATVVATTAALARTDA